MRHHIGIYIEQDGLKENEGNEESPPPSPAQYYDFGLKTRTRYAPPAHTGLIAGSVQEESPRPVRYF